MDNYHVTKDGDQWKMTKEGGSRATAVADTKAEIIDKAQDFSKTHEMSLKIHKTDGTFQEERTYPRSSDPSKSPG